MTLQVTQEATKELKDLLESTEKEPEQVIRLQSDQTGNAGFVLDIEREGDHVVHHEGEAVMVVDPVMSQNLEGATLDVKESPQGPSFTLR